MAAHWSQELPDPWSVVGGETHPDRARPRWQGWTGVAASALLGAAGPVARLWVDGFHGRALTVGLLASAWAVLLRRRPSTPFGLLLLAAAAVGVPLATWATIGRAPVLLAFAGVLVAQGALVSWAPTRSWPRRSDPVASLALLPVTLAQVLWFRTGDRLLAALLLVAALAVLETYHRAPAATARADAAFLRFLTAVATAVGAAVLFVAVAVLLYLPGAVGALVDSVRRGRRRRSYWVPRSPDPEVVRRDARRPFASTEPRVRLARHLAGGAVVVVLALTCAALVIDRRDPAPEPRDDPAGDVFQRGREVRFSELAAFRGVPFADELKGEQDTFSNEHLVPSEVGGYDMADFTGRYTNVRDGVRRTLEPPDCGDCPSAEVWLVGGSSAFGLGQRDEHTIASELVRLAAADGLRLRVVNLAVPGWTIHQETQKVEARLAGGETPDLVLFHDGYNDVIGTVIGSTVHGVRPDSPALMDAADIRAFTGGALDPSDVASAEELGELAARKYSGARERIAAVLSGRGVAALHSFQPDALASEAQYAEVEQVYEVGEHLRRYFDAALEVASRQLDGDVLDLRHLLDDAPPVFADLVHTNEEGARRVARALYPHVRGVLEPATRPSG